MLLQTRRGGKTVPGRHREPGDPEQPYKGDYHWASVGVSANGPASQEHSDPGNDSKKAFLFGNARSRVTAWLVTSPLDTLLHSRGLSCGFFPNKALLDDFLGGPWGLQFCLSFPDFLGSKYPHGCRSNTYAVTVRWFRACLRGKDSDRSFLPAASGQVAPPL